MIVELMFGAGVMLVGTATLRLWQRRRSLREAAATDAKAAEEAEESDFERRRRLAPRGLRVGDVLLHGPDELWLAGMVELDEEGFVLRLFSSPGGDRFTHLAQLDEEATELLPLRETEEVPDGRVPESLPVGGRRLVLERRGTADVHAEGERTFQTSPRAHYVFLRDAAGRTLLVIDFEEGGRISLIGDRVPRALFDHLPGDEESEAG